MPTETKPENPSPLASWNLRDLKNTRQNIIEAVQATQSVPPAFKAALVEAIGSLHPDVTLIRLDAHAQFVAFGGHHGPVDEAKSQLHINISIAPL